MMWVFVLVDFINFADADIGLITKNPAKGLNGPL